MCLHCMLIFFAQGDIIEKRVPNKVIKNKKLDQLHCVGLGESISKQIYFCILIILGSQHNNNNNNYGHCLCWPQTRSHTRAATRLADS